MVIHYVQLALANTKTADLLLNYGIVDTFNNSDFQLLTTFFWQYYSTATVSTFYLGNEAGSAFGYGHLDDGTTFATLEWKPFTNGTEVFPVLDDRGYLLHSQHLLKTVRTFDMTTDSIFPPDDSDFRDFIGYQMVKQAQAPIWIPPYAYVGSTSSEFF